MSDLDKLLANAIEDYKVKTMPRIKAAGTPAAYAVAEHRKHVRAALLSVIVLAVVAVPIALYASSGGNNAGPAPIGQSSGPSIVPSSPSGSAAPSPSAAPSSGPAVAADVPITQDEVSNATLDMPSWKGGWCPTGTQTLHDGVLPGATARDGTPLGYHELSQVVPAAFDGGGTADAIALFHCGPGDPPYSAAIALRRAADGSIVTVAPVGTSVDTIMSARSNSDGTVSLLVSDLKGSDGDATAAQTAQWRTYKLAGAAFRQVGGSTSFTTSSSGITATESDLVFAKPDGDERKGTMSVTVTNHGTRTVTNASVIFYGEAFQSLTPGCSPTGALQDAIIDRALQVVQCQAGSLAPGASKTLTFFLGANTNVFTGVSSPDKVGDWAVVQVLVGDRRLATQPSGGSLVLQ